MPTLFDVPAVDDAREKLALAAALPSFLYFPTPEEQEPAAWIALPWNADPMLVAGVFARDHGALVPTRHVSSAKSWLSNAVSRSPGALLPWTAEASRRSPRSKRQRAC